MCFVPDESNNILQMKTTFKKINPRNKLGVSTHSCYDYEFTYHNYNNNQKLKHSKEDYKISRQGRQILFVTFVGGGGHKSFECKNRRQ